MEVRIGIQDSPREVFFDVNMDAAKLAETISKAWAKEELLTLEDSHGRRIMVPTGKLAYVELGPSTPSRVGFGAS